MFSEQGQTGSSNWPLLIRQTGPIRRTIYLYLWLRQYYPQGEMKQSDSRLSDKMFETLLLLKANALCGLNPALLGGFPQVLNPPIDLSSSLQ